MSISIKTVASTQYLRAHINETRSIPVIDKTDDESILRFFTMYHTDKFGKYEIRICHDMSKGGIEIIQVLFDASEGSSDEH